MAFFEIKKIEIFEMTFTSIKFLTLKARIDSDEGCKGQIVFSWIYVLLKVCVVMDINLIYGNRSEIGCTLLFPLFFVKIFGI